jgi:glycine cleavage system aminomethyltransferase T
MIAEWIVDGATTIPSHQVDISRFHDYALKDRHVRSRAAEYFQKVYGIVHPQEQWAASRNVRLSPFVQRQRELGAVFHETGGWERPYWYNANKQLLNEFDVPRREGWEAMWWSPIIGAEHLAVRNRVGMIDLTAFVKFDVVGPGAASFIERMAVRRMDRPVGSVIYTSLLDVQGGIKCDLTIMRLAEDRYRVITSAAIGTHDITWFRKHCPTDGSVYIHDVTSSLCCVGVWGPKSRDLMQSVCENDVSDDAFPFATAQQVTIDEIPALAARVSYVGELGWEVYTSTGYGEKLWDVLWQAGQEHGVIAAGISVYLSSMRLEKGYRSWGHELHTGYNLFEAGLLKDASFDKPTPIKRAEFIGRDALIRLREQKASHRLCCMTFDEPGDVVLGYEPILDGDRVLGYVTSSDHGYSVGKGIAYGYLPPSHVEPGTPVEVEYLGRRLPATVTLEPLFDPEGLRPRS